MKDESYTLFVDGFESLLPSCPAGWDFAELLNDEKKVRFKKEREGFDKTRQTLFN
jgi:hypothetical protein